MSTNALDTLETQFPSIVAAMPDPFDTHDFILHLAHQHQTPYALALAAYAHTGHPFLNVHREIARRLGCRHDLVRRDGQRNSPDIFRQTNSATCWRKRP